MKGIIRWERLDYLYRGAIMNKILLVEIVIAYILCLAFSGIVFAGKDYKGSKDHPLFPRMDGSFIVGYDHSEFGELRLPLAPAIRKPGRVIAPEKEKALEGELTRLFYIAPESRSALEIIRNYEIAFENVGNYESLFQCAGKSCGKNFLSGVIFSAERDMPHMRGLNLFGKGIPLDSGLKNPRYLGGKVDHATGTTYISLAVADRTHQKGPRKKYGLPASNPVVLIELVDVKGMDESMVFVSADEMASRIEKDGHIALYGIYFDFDKADLKPESDHALVEIAKLLEGDTSMKLYVVGHTDNKGSPEYNLDLSMRRARSVIKALISRHGISADRMYPFGNGLYAPIATNDTEEGRAKNRRVELVKR